MLRRSAFRLLSKNNACRYYSTLPPLLKKILIANRGEIACRIAQTARRVGVKSVAVYSDADRKARHVELADEAHYIGPPPARESYLLGDKLLDLAQRTGAQGIHPGYGFLSENASFALACEERGIKFIGPPASAIASMGSKSAAKEIMTKANVPVVPGYHGADQSLEKFAAEAKKIGYPVLFKAVLGGGGKGMRIVQDESELKAAMESSMSEASSSFNDTNLLVEKYITKPRHIEIQVFADEHGNVVYLFERDCSLQRRYQKVIEEAPAPGLSEELRAKMGTAACDAARAVGYVGAGTVEFIFDTESDAFYFMEMNTRLQVEHPVTELITGQDLVEWQLKVASGHPLPRKQEELKITGHAFESRIYAENPQAGFLPQTGTLHFLRQPAASANVRVDTGVRQGDEVSIYYDPMIAKLITYDVNRNAALRRMSTALEQYEIVGIHTNVDFVKRICNHPNFIDAELDTGFIPRHLDALIPAPTPAPRRALALVALYHIRCDARVARDSQDPWSRLGGFRVSRNLTRTFSFREGDSGEVSLDVTYHDDGERFSCRLNGDGEEFSLQGDFLNSSDASSDLWANVAGERYTGHVTRHETTTGWTYTVFVDGENYELEVPHYAALLGLGEAVAGEGALLSPMPGKVIGVSAAVGDRVSAGDELMLIEAMKMVHTIKSAVDGVVDKINVKEGSLVADKELLAVVTAASD